MRRGVDRWEFVRLTPTAHFSDPPIPLCRRGATVPKLPPRNATFCKLSFISDIRTSRKVSTVKKKP